jgi:hypothetical protein
MYNCTYLCEVLCLNDIGNSHIDGSTSLQLKITSKILGRNSEILFCFYFIFVKLCPDFLTKYRNRAKLHELEVIFEKNIRQHKFSNDH